MNIKTSLIVMALMSIVSPSTNLYCMDEETGSSSSRQAPLAYAVTCGFAPCAVALSALKIFALPYIAPEKVNIFMIKKGYKWLTVLCGLTTAVAGVISIKNDYDKNVTDRQSLTAALTLIGVWCVAVGLR